MINNPHYWVIIPAAGVGRRMDSTLPKQYLKFNQEMIIEHIVSLFSSHPLVKQVVVVLHAEDRQWANIKIADPDKVVTTIGGETRAESVLEGLSSLQLKAAEHDWILVHDAARPCLYPEALDRFINTIADHPVGGLLALPIVDTIKKVGANHHVQKTISREGLWTAQTPQMFRFGVLWNAMKKALKAGVVVTDEASAVEWIGEEPLVVEGDWRNIKITCPADLARI